MPYVEQRAGRIVVEGSNPSPVWFTIKNFRHGVQKEEIGGMQENDLHDLRYAIDRVLAQLERLRS